jgi:hypothetical protein
VTAVDGKTDHTEGHVVEPGWPRDG